MELLDKLKKKSKSIKVVTIAKESGIPSQRIRDWLRGKGKPKADDVKKIEAWLNGETIKDQEAQPSLGRTDEVINNLKMDVGMLFKELIEVRNRLDILENKKSKK